MYSIQNLGISDITSMGSYDSIGVFRSIRILLGLRSRNGTPVISLLVWCRV